jgi:hypothetical protein
MSALVLEGPDPAHKYYKDMMDSLADERKVTDAIIKKEGRFKAAWRYSLDKDYAEYKSLPHMTPGLHFCVCFARSGPGMIR